MKISGSSAAEIYESIRLQVSCGALQSGALLPPVRDLAEQLDVNRNTVAAAYRKLVVSGIAVAQGRLGTTIRGHQGPGEQEGASPETPLIDLASGNPDPAWLPDTNKMLAGLAFRPRLYGDPPVNAALENHARRWLEQDCPAEFDLNLTNGAVDAIERLLYAHLVAGDKIAVESPCFLSSINIVRIAGIQAIGVPVDEEGMSAEQLEAALAKGVKAVILTPRAHNPTGCGLSDKRAKSLRRVLAKYPQVFVIVDDHFALLAESPYNDAIPATTAHWALVRSVSKVLGPDLRLAFVASDRQTSERLRMRLASGTNWVSHLLQDIVHECLTSDTAAAVFSRARSDYMRKRAILRDALIKHGLQVSGTADGLNLWVPLRGDSHTVTLALARKGWLVRSGEVFTVGETARGVRITISSIDEAQADLIACEIRRAAA